MSYCNKDDVNNLFGDISDDISDEMFTTVINNSTAWIDSNLKRHYLPIPTDNPQALTTVAIYHSASDILLSLYHGEELPVQYDIWFQKAQDLLDAYINDQLNNAEDTEVISNTQIVKHSQSMTYKAKRRRPWVR